jgi:hypothetical protein
MVFSLVVVDIPTMILPSKPSHFLLKLSQQVLHSHRLLITIIPWWFYSPIVGIPTVVLSMIATSRVILKIVLLWIELRHL